VIDVYEICHEGEDLRLLKIRNPWGHGLEWNGDWGDDSDLWTDKLKHHVGYKGKNDGEFFMNFSDYLKHFKNTTYNLYPQEDEAEEVMKFQGAKSFQEEIVTYSFEIEKTVNLAEDFFAIMSNQCGPRIQNYCTENDQYYQDRDPENIRK
jgi:hypothetical protein